MTKPKPKLIARLVKLRPDQAAALRQLAQREPAHAGHPPVSRVLRRLLDAALGLRPPPGAAP